MGKDRMSETAYRKTTEDARRGGKSATHKAEEQMRAGRGLSPLVDPKAAGVIRRSITRMDKAGEAWVSTMGLAMLLEVRLDTTSSMGDNVDRALDALPRMYGLLTGRPQAVLSRYDLQIITSIFNDRDDPVILCRSQAEMDVKIAEQLTLMVPVRMGGDTPEDPQYGLFAAAYLTWSSAKKFGLKTYDFTITDAPGRDSVDKNILLKIFGDEVLDRVKENGYQIGSGELPTTEMIVRDLLKTTHAFVLIVNNSSETTEFWNGIYGRERVVILPSAELIPETQAAIIGLTEGRLDLQSLDEYLRTEAQMDAIGAKNIRRAVAGVPIGAQSRLANFSKVFAPGAKFSRKGDIWPVGTGPTADEPQVPSKPNKKPDMWL